jgi:acetylornithine deacetylase/succinyl-diaminopimelate desuccinylase-like protein
VRNRSGISHAPDESVELDDAAVAAELMLGALDELG